MTSLISLRRAFALLFLLGALAPLATAAVTPLATPTVATTSSLAISDSKLAPSAVDSGDTFSLQFTVTNTGDAATGSGFWVRVYASPDVEITGAADSNDVVVYAQWVPVLAAKTGSASYPPNYSITGKALSVSTSHVGVDANQVLPAGKYFMAIDVDYFKQVKNNANLKQIFPIAGTLTVAYAAPTVPNSPIPTVGMRNVSAVRDLRWKADHAALYDVYLAKISECEQVFDKMPINIPVKKGQTSVPILPRKVLPLDVDNDGRIDILAGYNDTLSWFKNTPTTTGDLLSTPTLISTRVSNIRDFTASAYIGSNIDKVAGSRKVLDLDNNTTGDLVAISYMDGKLNDEMTTGGAVVWFSGKGKGAYDKGTKITWETVARNADGTTQTVKLATMMGITSVDAADFDNDGDVDLVAGGDSFVLDENEKLCRLVLFWNDLKNQPAPAAPKEGDPPAPLPVPNFVPTPIQIQRTDSNGNKLYEADNVTPLLYNVNTLIADVKKLVVTDYDNDGWPDIVFISLQGNSLILLHNENKPPEGQAYQAPFKPFTMVRLAQVPVDTPTTLHVADLNGNAFDDILVATNTYQHPTLSWYENKGTTTSAVAFKNHLISNDLANISEITTGDLNGDGILDVAAASSQDDTIAWYANDGNKPLPTFTPKTAAFPSDYISSIGIADIDGDGLNDFISASLLNKAICWFKNNPLLGPANLVSHDQIDPFYQPPAPLDYSTPYAWKIVAKAGDNQSEGPAWNFKTQSTRILPNLTSIPAMVEVPEMNKLDFNFENVGSSDLGSIKVAVYFSPVKDLTQAQLWWTITFGGLSLPAGKATPAQFTLNERDLPQGVYYLITVVDPGETFTNHTYGDDIFVSDEKLVVLNIPDKPTSPTPANLAKGVNGMASLHWPPTAHTTSYDLKLVKATSFDLLITPSELPGDVPRANAIATGDLNGDQSNDIVCASGYGGGTSSGRIDWFRNNAQGAFQPVPVTSNPFPNASCIIIANMTKHPKATLGGDTLDVVSASYTTGKIQGFKNDGQAAPKFTPFTIATGGQQINDLKAGDINGDGNMDIVSASFQGWGLAWHRSDGGATPKFTTQVIDNTSGLAACVAVGDINGDGRADIVAGFWAGLGTANYSLAWYESVVIPLTGKVQFIRHLISTDVDEPRCLALAQMDKNGFMDVICASGRSGQVAWFKNNGRGTFTKNVIKNASGVAYLVPSVLSVIAVDFNHDGRMDIVAASSAKNTIDWFMRTADAAQPFTHYLIASPQKTTGDSDIQPVSLAAADVNGDTYKNKEIVGSFAAGGKVCWYNYGMTFKYDKPTNVVVTGLTSPTSTPNPLLTPNWAYQWQVTCNNAVHDDQTTYTRGVTGPVWSFETGQPNFLIKANNLNTSPTTVTEITQGNPIAFTWIEQNNGTSAPNSGHWDVIWASPDDSFTFDRSGSNDIQLGAIWKNPQTNDAAGVTMNLTVNSGDIGKEAQDKSRLHGGATGGVLPLGTYSIAVRLDDSGQISQELDASDNVAVMIKKLLVKAPAGQAAAGLSWQSYR